MKIGIYGGTFDPPHLGHMKAAAMSMKYLGLDRLFLIPTKQPPHKELPENAASPEDRLAMTELMADGLGKNVQALDLELRRDGKSYTADTVEQLHKQYPDDELWLLVGTDMFLSLQTWHQPERILRMAGIAAFSRWEQDDGEVLQKQSDFLRETYGAKEQIIPLPRVTEVSSTQLRGKLASGDSAAASLLWIQVYGYILRHELYGTHADMKQLSDEQLRAVSYSMVKAKRIPHIRGTESTAVKLAERWGANPQYARRAAILHDCTKYLELEEQLKLCRKYGILLDDLEKVAVKLLHSKTGAALARSVFGEPEPVWQAICWHTTGKENMTTLEKILYLADYMEPNRDFDGVEALRKLVWEDLDQAMTLGLTMTVEEMKQRGVPVHSNTLRALAWLTKQSSS